MGALICPKFSAIRIRSDRGVLAIRASLALERQCLFEIKCDNRISGKLQKKVPEGANCARLRRFLLRRLRQIGMTRFYFFERVAFQPINQIVGFDADTLASALLNVWLLSILGLELMTYIFADGCRYCTLLVC